MHNRYLRISVLCIIITFVVLSVYESSYGTEPEPVILKEGDEWSYFKGNTEPPEKWYYREFDDSKWEKGASGFGYGLGIHNTLLDDMKGHYQNIYVRKKFNVFYRKRVTSVKLSVLCDGAFVAYLNMIEVIRSDKKGRGDILNLSGFGHELEPGQNVLSIKCSNDKIQSEGFTFLPAFEVLTE